MSETLRVGYVVEGKTDYIVLDASFRPIECRQEVERLLIGKPDRLVRDHEGRARKDPQRYEKAAYRIAAGWPQAIAACPEAQCFDNDCRAALPL